MKWVIFLSLLAMPVAAQDVHVSRAEFLRAVAGHEIVEDPFDRSIANSAYVIFESGPLSVFTTDVPRTFENRVRKGRFESGVDVTGELAPKRLEWRFPEPVVGFGADWFFALSGDGLTFEVDVADQTYQIALEETLSGNGTGFWGFVSPQAFRSVTIRGTHPIKGTSEQFAVDDLVFALAKEETS